MRIAGTTWSSADTSCRNLLNHHFLFSPAYLAHAGDDRQGRAGADDLSRERSLVLLRPFKRRLLLHFLYFKNEIRDFSQIGKGEGEKVSSDEIDLARGLIEKMSSADFDPERYEDEYGERAQAMIEEKVKGHEIKAAPKASERGAKVVDIMAALKQSLAEKETKRPAKATAKEKKRKAGS